MQRMAVVARAGAIAVGSMVAVLLAAPLALAQTVDGPKVEWKMATWGKPRAFTAGMETVAKHVSERTGGKFTITIGYESFGGPKEILDILSVGGLEMTSICSSYHPDKHPAYTALDLPFLPLPSFDVQEKVHEAFHKHPYIISEMKRWKAQFYMSNLLPQYEFMGRGKPPRTIADFKGMRVRAIGGIGEAMRRLGAVPTSVDATEVYTIMERGAVDAASFPSTYAHAAYKLHEVSKWWTENMSPGTQACPSLINVDAWVKLPEQYKKLFDEAKPLAYEALKKAYAAADERNLKAFKERGIEFVKYGDAELAEFRKLGAQPVWDAWVQEMSGKGIPAKELLDLIFTAANSAGKS